MMGVLCGPLTSRSDSLSEGDHCCRDRAGELEGMGSGALGSGFRWSPCEACDDLGLPPNVPKSHEQFGEVRGTHWSRVFGSRIRTHEGPLPDTGTVACRGTCVGVVGAWGSVDRACPWMEHRHGTRGSKRQTHRPQQVVWGSGYFLGGTLGG